MGMAPLGAYLARTTAERLRSHATYRGGRMPQAFGSSAIADDAWFAARTAMIILVNLVTPALYPVRL
jgi:hypothetical protein